MREQSHDTVWDCGRYAVRDDEGDCNLYEQFCLRVGQRTADYNPSVTSLRTGDTSPCTGGAFRPRTGRGEPRRQRPIDSAPTAHRGGFSSRQEENKNPRNTIGVPGVLKPCLEESKRFSYFIMEATSAAKSSSAFSMPSPVMKRVKALTTILPPSSLATAATCCSTEILFSLTKACCSRQFSS